LLNAYENNKHIKKETYSWTPWTKFSKSINHERYKCLENKIKTQIVLDI
jgi:hypothetical protein